ncbi:MAG: hypothetical protein WD042_00430 [Phycisphaeraceae bacterium]
MLVLLIVLAIHLRLSAPALAEPPQSVPTAAEPATLAVIQGLSSSLATSIEYRLLYAVVPDALKNAEVRKFDSTLLETLRRSPEKMLTVRTIEPSAVLDKLRGSPEKMLESHLLDPLEGAVVAIQLTGISDPAQRRTLMHAIVNTYLSKIRLDIELRVTDSRRAWLEEQKRAEDDAQQYAKQLDQYLSDNALDMSTPLKAPMSEALSDARLQVARAKARLVTMKSLFDKAGQIKADTAPPWEAAAMLGGPLPAPKNDGEVVQLRQRLSYVVHHAEVELQITEATVGELVKEASREQARTVEWRQKLRIAQRLEADMKTAWERRLHAQTRLDEIRLAVQQPWPVELVCVIDVPPVQH